MNPSILVADDDTLMRTLIVKLLRTMGLTEIIEAANGREALALFDQNEPSLVIMDWHMPDKNGLDVVKCIRATGSQVPIIMVTSEAKKEWILAAVEAGTSAYVIKPFDQDTLKEKVGRFLPVDQPC